LGAAAAVRDAIGVFLPPTERRRHETAVATAQANLGNAAWEIAWAEGRVMPLERAIVYALEEAGDG
jgi:hypothetical protein